MSQHNIHIPKELSKMALEPQAETISYGKRSKKLFIGIPKETTFQERRVPLIPSSVQVLTGQGHRIVIQRGAGEASNFADHEYSEAGAELISDIEGVLKADIVLKVAPPTSSEIKLFKPDQILISPIHLPAMEPEYIRSLMDKRVIALAMEYIQDAQGSFPVVRIMSEIAGYSALLTAAELLCSEVHGKGMLLGGISGVPPSKVIILGAGVVAEFATRMALGLGAEVRIFDNNIYKIKRLQHQLGRNLYTSVINPITLSKELKGADVAIGAIHSKSGRAPVVVTEDMVRNMKAGSVIIDVSIDQGGCFETSEVSTHSHPTFVKHEVIHYCVPNIASKVPRTASVAVSNILTPILIEMESNGGLGNLLHHHSGLRNGVYTYKGCLTNEYLGRRLDIKPTPLDLLLTSQL